MEPILGLTAVDSTVDVSSSFPCNLCKKSFTKKHNLLKHQRNVHNIEQNCVGFLRLRCPQQDCEYTCSWMDPLRHHLRNCHDIHIEEIELTFPSMSEFSKWREEEERSSKSSFVAGSGVRTLQDGSKLWYLRCHRSGSYKSKRLGKRKLKAKGSCRIDRCCPASMKVEDRKTNVNVHYYKTHCGHGSNLGDAAHLRLMESERALIAGKLSQGITFEELLDELRNSSQDKFNRMHLLTRKDLHNIRRSFKVQVGPDESGEPDTWESWVEKANSLGDECPILYCKDRGVAAEGGLSEFDFLLVLCSPVQREMLARFGNSVICIDATEPVPSADFVLISVVVMDEYGEPFPAAFCLSNRVDVVAYLCFFEAIRDGVGKITPTIFVSDDCSAVYDTWSHVMGDYENRYLCPWWMEQALKTMVSTITRGKQVTRTSTHRWLQSLLIEMDLEKFHQGLSAFLKEVQEHKESFDFASRFQNQFAHRPETWAHAFMGPDLSKVMCSLETMHRALKCAFLKGTEFRHLVRCISALEKLVQDRNNSRLAKSDSVGGDGQNVPDGDAGVLVEVVEEDRLWIVKIGLQESHSVHRTSDTCLVASCTRTSCNHCYACSCTHYLGRQKSCGHIQAVAQLRLIPNATQSSETENTDMDLDRSVEEKMQTILGFLKKKKFDQDLLKQMEEQMDVWITQVKKGSQTHVQNNTQPPIQPESSCKDIFLLIYPQQVSSTMNLKVPISRYKSPVSTLPVKKAIVSGHPGFDHTYT